MNLYQKAMRDFARDFLTAALQEHGGVKAAALALGVNRTALHAILKKLGLRTAKPRYFGNWGDLADAKGRDT
jgi:transcriptional regulator with GAF, ATPase, and Fis domain